jgi:hypothetical protein
MLYSVTQAIVLSYAYNTQEQAIVLSYAYNTQEHRRGSISTTILPCTV